MTDKRQQKARSEEAEGKIRLSDYRKLSEFRYLIRCFLDFSKEKARAVGLTPRQHQAILAIKGFAQDRPVAVSDLAERLCIRHHSAVELVDRLCESGLVRRDQDHDDHRRVFLRLTEKSEEHLEGLSAAHLDELARIEPMLKELLNREHQDSDAA